MTIRLSRISGAAAAAILITMMMSPASPAAGDEGHPVLIGIWDTGTDVDVFPSQLFVNEAERADGADTDGNGFVDDIHGIAFGNDLEKSTGLLMTLGFDTPSQAELRTLLQAVEDRRAGLNTPALERMRKLGKTLDAEEKAAFGEKIVRFDIFCHGTHVAGIALAGNPTAKILPVRVGFDDSALKTKKWARDFVAMCDDTIAYFKQHGVRIANMSWGWDVHEIDDNLRRHDVGRDPEERARLAGEIYAILDEGLHAAIAGAPEILFVNGAGGAPGDPGEYRWIPGVYDLPNIMVVGAVDSEGNLTPFSNHGSHVRLYANGNRVESPVPGGERLRLSGTSMATPQVTNLAARILALDPSLAPCKVKKLILDGAEPAERGGRELLVLDPKRTLELFEARR